jgi:hypothetical protein
MTLRRLRHYLGSSLWIISVLCILGADVLLRTSRELTMRTEESLAEEIPAPRRTLPAKLPFVDERATASAVWWEAGALIRRHPAAMLLPAAFLGMIIELPYLLPDFQYVLQEILAFLT